MLIRSTHHIPSIPFKLFKECKVFFRDGVLARWSRWSRWSRGQRNQGHYHHQAQSAQSAQSARGTAGYFPAESNLQSRHLPSIGAPPSSLWRRLSSGTMSFVLSKNDENFDRSQQRCFLIEFLDGDSNRNDGEEKKKS